MGVIGMKIFADGAMYSKPAEWSNNPGHVVRTVGSPALPCKSLIQYSLTTPGVHLVIIGIGQISDNPEKCQLINNLEAAQVLPDGMSETERTEVEEMAKRVKEGKTNYFQMAALPLTAPVDVEVSQVTENSSCKAVLAWGTALAGDAPITKYELWRDDLKITEIPFKPQITTDKFTYTDNPGDEKDHIYTLKVIDAKGRIAESVPVKSAEH